MWEHDPHRHLVTRRCDDNVDYDNDNKVTQKKMLTDFDTVWSKDKSIRY